MCSFDRPWFGATYPDSYCVDGYLHDVDGDGYDPDDESHPCPRCNTREFLAQQHEEARTTEWRGWGAGFGMTYVTGHQIWDTAKAWARQENPNEAEALISSLDNGQHSDDRTNASGSTTDA